MYWIFCLLKRMKWKCKFLANRKNTSWHTRGNLTWLSSHTPSPTFSKKKPINLIMHEVSSILVSIWINPVQHQPCSEIKTLQILLQMLAMWVPYPTDLITAAPNDSQLPACLLRTFKFLLRTFFWAKTLFSIKKIRQYFTLFWPNKCHLVILSWHPEY